MYLFTTQNTTMYGLESAEDVDSAIQQLAVDIGCEASEIEKDCQVWRVPKELEDTIEENLTNNTSANNPILEKLGFIQ
jgi:hypothetical protein